MTENLKEEPWEQRALTESARLKARVEGPLAEQESRLQEQLRALPFKLLCEVAWPAASGAWPRLGFRRMESKDEWALCVKEGDGQQWRPLERAPVLVRIKAAQMFRMLRSEVLRVLKEAADEAEDAVPLAQEEPPEAFSAP